MWKHPRFYPNICVLTCSKKRTITRIFNTSDGQKLEDVVFHKSMARCNPVFDYFEIDQEKTSIQFFFHRVEHKYRIKNSIPEFFLFAKKVVETVGRSKLL